jgi:hydroxymethylpyrimidine kinase/phosphomethylpyrimidine kinase
MKRILTIAGSDSGGGAGIQADLKAITVLGAYGMSVITAVTAQNTIGVQGVHPVPVSFIGKQMESVLSDIGADAVKTGMLATEDVVEAVAEQLRKYRVKHLVVDPVMVSTSGSPLIAENAIEIMKRTLFPLADLVTPNLSEASLLSGFPISNLSEMRRSAERIHDLGPSHVLIKGGHHGGDALDILFDGDSFYSFTADRIHTRNTHGTGCTLSAALATFLAQGYPMNEAVAKAKKFITRAISSGLKIGAGHGPTNPYSYILEGQVRSDK